MTFYDQTNRKYMTQLTSTSTCLCLRLCTVRVWSECTDATNNNYNYSTNGLQRNVNTSVTKEPASGFFHLNLVKSLNIHQNTFLFVIWFWIGFEKSVFRRFRFESKLDGTILNGKILTPMTMWMRMNQEILKRIQNKKKSSELVDIH